MKLNPSDEMIAKFRRQREEKEEKMRQKPQYKVVEVVDNTTMFCIASKFVGFPYANSEGVEGFARPFWAIEIGGSLDLDKPNHISSLMPHWVWEKRLDTELMLDDSKEVILNPFADADCFLWGKLDLDDDETLDIYINSLKDKMIYAREFGVFPLHPKECDKFINDIIVKAWSEYWEPTHYMFKAHNYLNHTLDKPILKVLKATVKFNTVWVSYQFPDGSKGFCPLSRKDLDDLSSLEENWVSYVPVFDTTSKARVLPIKGWEIYALVSVNGVSKMKVVTSVINIKGLFYRVDKKIIKDSQGALGVELPKDYMYAPEESIYDAAFNTKKSGNGNNRDVASNYFVDPLARQARKQAEGFGIVAQKKKKEKPADIYERFMVEPENFVEETEL